MQDHEKTKAQLIEELQALRQQLTNNYVMCDFF